MPAIRTLHSSNTPCITKFNQGNGDHRTTTPLLRWLFSEVDPGLDARGLLLCAAAGEGPNGRNGDVLLDVLEISGSIGLSRKWILPPCGNILFSRLLTFANVFIQSAFSNCRFMSLTGKPFFDLNPFPQYFGCK